MQRQSPAVIYYKELDHIITRAPQRPSALRKVTFSTQMISQCLPARHAKRIPAILHAAKLTVAMIMQLKKSPRYRDRNPRTKGQPLPDTLFIKFEIGHDLRAPQKLRIEEDRRDPRESKSHHLPVPATPSFRTMSVYQDWVCRLANVVATMTDLPATTALARPENEELRRAFCPRVSRKRAPAKSTAAASLPTITQSIQGSDACRLRADASRSRPGRKAEIVLTRLYGDYSWSLSWCA